MKIILRNKDFLFEKFFSVFVIETIFFVLPFLIFWWAFYLLNWNVIIGILIGFIITIILNLLFLKKFINNFYSIKYIYLMLIHLFFSICIFGFFMGVPIFNIIPGILGGIYIASRSKKNNFTRDRFEKQLTYSNIYSAGVLCLILISSAYIALSDEYTAANLEGMFKLQFHITDIMIWGIIIFGGILLLFLQYVISLIVSKKTFQNKEVKYDDEIL